MNATENKSDSNIIQYFRDAAKFAAEKPKRKTFKTKVKNRFKYVLPTHL